MNCVKYNLKNTGDTVVTFNYQRCDNAELELQVKLAPNQNKIIWAIKDTLNIPNFFSNTTTVEELTETIPECATLVNIFNLGTFYYNPLTDVRSPQMVIPNDIVRSLDVAHSEEKLWKLYNPLPFTYVIREWGLTGNPPYLVSSTYRDLTFPSNVVITLPASPGLCQAPNGNLVFIDFEQNVWELTVPVAPATEMTATLKYQLPSGYFVGGDFLVTVNNKLLVASNTEVGGVPYIALYQFDYNTGSFEFESKTVAINNYAATGGIAIFNNEIYIYGVYVYKMDKTAPYGGVRTSLQGAGGASSTIKCNTAFLTGSVTPTPTPTTTTTPTVTPTTFTGTTPTATQTIGLTPTPTPTPQVCYSFASFDIDCNNAVIEYVDCCGDCNYAGPFTIGTGYTLTGVCIQNDSITGQHVLNIQYSGACNCEVTPTPTPTNTSTPEGTPTPTPTATSILETPTCTPTVTQTSTPTSTLGTTPTPTETNVPPTPTPTVSETCNASNFGNCYQYMFVAYSAQTGDIQFGVCTDYGPDTIIWPGLSSGSYPAVSVIDLLGEGWCISANTVTELSGNSITEIYYSGACCTEVTATPTPTPTLTPSPTDPITGTTQTPTATPTQTPENSPCPTCTPTKSPTPTPSATDTYSGATPTVTPTPTSTPYTGCSVYNDLVITAESATLSATTCCGETIEFTIPLSATSFNLSDFCIRTGSVSVTGTTDLTISGSCSCLEMDGMESQAIVCGIETNWQSSSVEEAKCLFELSGEEFSGRAGLIFYRDINIPLGIGSVIYSSQSAKPFVSDITGTYVYCPNFTLPSTANSPIYIIHVTNIGGVTSVDEFHEISTLPECDTCGCCEFTPTPTETPTATPTSTSTPINETPTPTPTETSILETPTQTPTNTETPTPTSSVGTTPTPTPTCEFGGCYHYVEFTISGYSEIDWVYCPGTSSGQVYSAETYPATFLLGPGLEVDCFSGNSYTVVSGSTPYSLNYFNPCCEELVTPTPTPSQTSTPAVSPTCTPTESETPTPTPSVTSTETPPVTPSCTPTESETPTPTPSVTSTETPPLTPSCTPTFTPTCSPTFTPTPSPTPCCEITINNSSLDVQVTDVTVDGSSATVIGGSMPNQPGTTTTLCSTLTGLTRDIRVGVFNSVPGQKITLCDSNGTCVCQNITGTGPSNYDWLDVVFECGSPIVITVEDGLCGPPPQSPTPAEVTPTPTPTEEVTPTPTITPTPTQTSGPIGGFSFNLIALPYNFPSDGNAIMNAQSPAQTGTTLINELSFTGRGFYFSSLDFDSVDTTPYFSGFTGQSITMTFTQNGDSAIYSGDTESFKPWSFSGGTGFVFGTGIGVPPSGTPSGSAVLTQSATTTWVTGDTVYVSAVLNV